MQTILDISGEACVLKHAGAFVLAAQLYRAAAGLAEYRGFPGLARTALDGAADCEAQAALADARDQLLATAGA